MRLFMVIVLRSFSGTLVTMAVVALSSVTALGLAGYAGIKLSPISLMARAAPWFSNQKEA